MSLNERHMQWPGEAEAELRRIIKEQRAEIETWKASVRRLEKELREVKRAGATRKPAAVMPLRRAAK